MASVWLGYDLLNRTLYAHFGSATGRGETDVYDALGRLTSSTQSTSPTFSNTLVYQYDLAGDRTRITWPDGFYAAYVYDMLQRPTQIQENGATTGRGLLASYIYDTLGRRSEIDRAGGTGATTNLGYRYDRWVSRLAQDLHGSANDVTFTPTYSPAFQTAAQGVTNDAYTFHPGALSTSYTPNGLNQYASVNSTSFSYDARGNLTSDGTRGFTYDLENHLLTASAPTSVTLGYDPLGRLQTSTAGSATTTLLYDGDMLAGEYDATNTLQNRYVPGPGGDEPLVWYIGSGTGQRQWLIPDTQGSIIAWADGSGALIASQAYDPYGGPSTWAGGSRYAYTGQLMIPEAQLYSYKARVYDPGLGRFLQTDSVGYVSDVNWYAYAGNDPVNGSDPSGLVEAEGHPPIYCAGNQNCSPVYTYPNGWQDSALPDEPPQLTSPELSGGPSYSPGPSIGFSPFALSGMFGGPNGGGGAPGAGRGQAVQQNRSQNRNTCAFGMSPGALGGAVGSVASGAILLPGHIIIGADLVAAFRAGVAAGELGGEIGAAALSETALGALLGGGVGLGVGFISGGAVYLLQKESGCSTGP